MSNTTSEHPVTPAAISVGSDGSPDQVSRHTPEDNARNLGDDSFLPEILQPIYDSEEQERKVKLAVVLAILDQLYAATAGKWILVKVGRESWIAATTQIVGNIVCESPDEWENSMLNWPDNCAWIIAAHNHYPTLREEIKRLREENVRLSDLAVQRANMIAQMDSKLATANRDGAVEELRRLADEWDSTIYQFAKYVTPDMRNRAAELEGSNG